MALLAIATLAAYWPAMRGAFIWDDEAHVTRPALQSLSGLGRIWFELGATQQYYPLLHSAFWLEHRLWGDAPLGYHLLNVALHVTAALLVLGITRRLLRAVQAAWADEAAFLAAAIFALHPVQVESVAWITEQKNTLSAVFYLAAFAVYLRYDETRGRSAYVLALTIFVLGLLCKTVTATLPAALLVVFWWQRGRLSIRRDVVPLIPFFIVGAAGGLFTAWVEHNLIGARGRAFDLDGVQRGLLAGQVVWFDLKQLIWPANLIFVYPRWTIDARELSQWLYPAGLLALLAVLLVVARRQRGPLAGLLFFIGTLFPVLGFFNVYPFLYSFVADHFQYLASLGAVVVFSSLLAAILSRIESQPARRGLLLVAPAILAVLTFRQARIYADNQTLYETTLARNPKCWMAHNNLGVILKNQGHPDQALERFRRALELRPEYPEALDNLGLALSATGRLDEAIAAHRQALKLYPNPGTLANLGNAYLRSGRAADGVVVLKQATELEPTDARLQANYGAVLEGAGRFDEARAVYTRALALDPQNAAVRARVDALRSAGVTGNAGLHALEQAAAAQPNDAAAQYALAVALAQANRAAEAIPRYERAVQLNPDYVEAHNNLAALLAQAGRLGDALPHFEAAVRLRPNLVETHMNLAVAYSRSGRGDAARGEAQRARELAVAAQQAELVTRIDEWIAANASGSSGP